jgi:hypothetical protein
MMIAELIRRIAMPFLKVFLVSGYSGIFSRPGVHPFFTQRNGVQTVHEVDVVGEWPRTTPQEEQP